MRISEITTRTGAGTVNTVRGNEISRSTPKIGGTQTTNYADGSIKQTNQVGGITQTKVGSPNTGNNTVAKTSIQTGNMNTSFSGSNPITAKNTSVSYKAANNKIHKATVTR
jgi:hypothetical protein|tara:strand:- start:2550 stop:2882 length:333 start_codon:yes stop_codon:yes gene_type:complete